MHLSISLPAENGRSSIEIRYDPTLVAVQGSTMYKDKPALAFTLLGKVVAQVQLNSPDKEFEHDYPSVPSRWIGNGRSINFFEWGVRTGERSPLQIIM